MDRQKELDTLLKSQPIYGSDNQMEQAISYAKVMVRLENVVAVVRDRKSVV